LKRHPFLTGIILGIVSPMLGIIIFYLWKAPSTRFAFFLQTMISNKTLLTATISFSLLINAIVFTWAVNTRRDRTAKGIFIVTLLITIPALIYKIFS
jgi:hypothetical protein